MLRLLMGKVSRVILDGRSLRWGRASSYRDDDSDTISPPTEAKNPRLSEYQCVKMPGAGLTSRQTNTTSGC